VIAAQFQVQYFKFHVMKTHEAKQPREGAHESSRLKPIITVPIHYWNNGIICRCRVASMTEVVRATWRQWAALVVSTFLVGAAIGALAMFLLTR